MATRRPLTDRQREIMQAERSHRRMQADATRELVAREQSHRETRIATESDLAGNRQKREVARTAVSVVNPTGDHGLFMTVIFMIVGLALFYNVVTKADQFSGFVGAVGKGLHVLSSPASLFQVKAK